LTGSNNSVEGFDVMDQAVLTQKSGLAALVRVGACGLVTPAQFKELADRLEELGGGGAEAYPPADSGVAVADSKGGEACVAVALAGCSRGCTGSYCACGVAISGRGIRVACSILGCGQGAKPGTDGVAGHTPA
jgi:hypothetical protein